MICREYSCWHARVRRQDAGSMLGLRSAGVLALIHEKESAELRNGQHIRTSVPIHVCRGHLDTDTGLAIDQMRFETALRAVAHEPEPIQHRLGHRLDVAS